MRTTHSFFAISTRNLLRLFCVLITSLCSWMMYFVYQTQLTNPRRTFSSFQNFNLLQQQKINMNDINILVKPYNQSGIMTSTDDNVVTHKSIGSAGDKKFMVDFRLKITAGGTNKDNVSSQQYPLQFVKLNASEKISHALSSNTLGGKINSSNLSRSPSEASLPTDIAVDSGYIVYICDSAVLCGGWGDRQKGLTSLYFVSRVVHRRFKIIMTTPCELSYFYIPNRIEWRVKENELKNLSSININAMYTYQFKSQIMSTDFNKKFPHKVIYIRTNSDFYDRLMKNSMYTKMIKQWKSLVDKRERFRWAWHDLMRPSPVLLKHLEHIVGSNFLIKKGLITEPIVKNSKKIKSLYDVNNSTLICGHVRIGKNPTIPMDEDLSNFKITDLPTLHGFMLTKGRTATNPYYFIAADYEYVKEKSRIFFGDRLVDYGGKIIHIDRQRIDHRACVGFEVALIDQLLLSLCDVLVICNSGFSRYASYLSNSTDDIYILENGQINKNNYSNIPLLRTKKMFNK